MDVIKLPSPNYFQPGQLPERRIAAVCLHGTSGQLNASIQWLRNPQSRVSANYVISKAGVIYQLVDWQAGRRAWANGIVENYDTSLDWLVDAVRRKINPNWITVSIEHEASKDEMVNHAKMTDDQFSASVALTAYILQLNGLKATHQTIIGHNQISGKNKYNCPGVIFPPAYTEQLIIRNPALKP